ncbi:MAG: DUF2889 domain-containing protein [Candidatus Schekmanbacteria bacterium]|nr:MAG: DUF2889 domain-containing protein [Candidatus Schekmanbacteria bacterium]
MAIFVRNILIDLDEVSPGLMRVSASMKDVVHDIRLTLFATFPEYEIKDVDLQMNETPEKNCPLFKELIGRIRGLKIGRGFNSQIRKLFRGAEGCPTVTGLLTVAAPLVINISWFIEKRKLGLSDSEYLDLKRKMMKDKCIAFSSMNSEIDEEVTNGERAIYRDCNKCPSADIGNEAIRKVILKLETIAEKYKIPQQSIDDIKDDIKDLLEREK